MKAFYKRRMASPQQIRKGHNGILFTFNNMYYLPYNKDLKTFSRKLRNNSTTGEILLWKKLRAGGIMNYTFNRQKPLKRYIVDFYCKPLNLVIEIDGGYHEEALQKIKDIDRQQALEEMGLSFLRFSDREGRNNINKVLKEIENHIVAYHEMRRS
jgi:very-short-patch-repair endonuclease